MELQERRRYQQQQAAAREHNRRVRETQRLAAQHARAVAAAERASRAERVQLEKAAHAAHVAEQEALAAAQTQAAEVSTGQLDELLIVGVEQSRPVDLDNLREVYEPMGLPAELTNPTPQPQFAAHAAPPILASSASSVKRGSRRWQREQDRLLDQYRAALLGWSQAFAAVYETNWQLRDTWRAQEISRRRDLDVAAQEMERENSNRRASVVERNRSVEHLEQSLERGEQSAIQEYLEIIAAGSVYPDEFAVEYELQFVADDKELQLSVTPPPPGELPRVKSVRYVKSTGGLVEQEFSQAECKRRYSSAIYQSILRACYEFFNGDSAGIVDAISLSVNLGAINPATGLTDEVCLAQLAVTKAEFMQLDLTQVNPVETLKYLRAALSKDLYRLVPIAQSGVR